MEALKCIIVDDEVLAQDVIENYIQGLPTLQLIGKCKNALEAISFLHDKEVDLMFLDINMPEISGLDMLRTLQNPPKVILTTAYSEFALEGYEFGVIDYLLKPIKFDRFIKAVNRAIEGMNKKQEGRSETKEELPASLFIKEDQITYSINFDDISHIEAYGNYLKIYTGEKTYVIRETMQNMLIKLPDAYFLRVHKSFIVRVSKIEKVDGNQLFVGDFTIPVGTTFKSELSKRLFDK